MQKLSKLQSFVVTHRKDRDISNNRICCICGSNKTYVNKRGYGYWHRTEENEITWEEIVLNPELRVEKLWKDYCERHGGRPPNQYRRQR
jgi:hypothetical protein